MWTIFKVFIAFVTILLRFYVSVFEPQGVWDLRSLLGIEPIHLHWKVKPNHWTTKEIPDSYFFYVLNFL